MQNIPFHIAYLLTQHECVIVPVLGAFVVRPKLKEKKSRWGILYPPENCLEFDSKINNHDLLLANSIAKWENCSIEEAYTLIEEYVSDVLLSFDEGKYIHIPLVGSLNLKDDEIFFQPDKSLSCNAANFGLTGFSLLNLQDFQKEAKTNLKRSIIKSDSIPFNGILIGFLLFIIAAIMSVAFIPIPFNDGRVETLIKRFSRAIQQPVQNAVNINDIQETAAELIIPELEDIFEIPEEEETASQTDTENLNDAGTLNNQNYYIIVASLSDQTSAQSTMEEITSKGFENVGILSSDDKYRVYINQFNNKKEAEKFLIQFRRSYPKYSNAWLLKYVE